MYTSEDEIAGICAVPCAGLFERDSVAGTNGANKSARACPSSSLSMVTHPRLVLADLHGAGSSRAGAGGCSQAPACDPVLPDSQPV